MQLFCIKRRKKPFRLHLHPREGEAFFSKVFQRGADVIDCAVDAEEAVMNLVKHLNFNWSVLRGADKEINLLFCMSHPLFKTLYSGIDGISTQKTV